MQLHCLLGDETGSAAHLGLGHRGQPSGIAVAAIQAQCRQFASCQRLFATHCHFSQAVLDDLELDQGPAELGALARMGHCHLEGRRHRAHGLPAQRHHGPTTCIAQLRGRSAIELIAIVHGHSLQPQVRRMGSVGATRHLDGQTARAGAHQENPLAWRRGARGRLRGGDEHGVGPRDSACQQLGAAQLPLPALAHCGRCCARPGIALASFFMRQRETQPPVHQAGQPGLRLSRPAELGHHIAGENGTGQIGLDHQMPAKSAHQQAGLQCPAAQPTHGLWQGQRQPAHGRELRPKLRAAAVGSVQTASALHKIIFAVQQRTDAGIDQALLFGQA